MKFIHFFLATFLTLCYWPFFTASANAINNDTLIDLVKVDKSERKMYLLYQDKVIKEYSIALGDKPEGHKQQEGDEKTPEGSYTLDYIKEDSAYYRSMHISYPSQLDRDKADKLGIDPGGYIMVHGQKNMSGELSAFKKKYDWTDGCIAISNDEMDEFIALVSTGTPIHIQW